MKLYNIYYRTGGKGYAGSFWATSASAALHKAVMQIGGRRSDYRAVLEEGAKLNRGRRNMAKKKKKKPSAQKRISAALSRYLKRMNPAKMRGVTHVRVRKLRGGGVSITPVRGTTTRRRRTKKR
jgi:hypothetical protein